MPEHIEREALIKELLSNAFTDDLYGMGLTRGIEISVATAKRINAADVAPVRHEKWEVIVGSDGKEHMVCTGCRKQQDLTGVFTYCPNCGAKMDLED